MHSPNTSCVMQVCFQLACTTYTAAWVNPSLFYPLSALPEILAVIILTWPGLLTMIQHSGLGFGNSHTIGPTTSSLNGGQHGTSYQNGQGGVNPRVTGSEGYPQRPYHEHAQAVESYAPQPYPHGASGQGYSEQPYEQRQSHPPGALSQQGSFAEPPGGGFESRGEMLSAQRVQHASSVPGQAQQGYQGYPQQHPQGALQQPNFPSQQPSLPFQQSRLPQQQVNLPFQPQGSLPSQPAPAKYESSALYQPHYPNHGHSPPSFFHNQQP